MLSVANKPFILSVSMLNVVAPCTVYLPLLTRSVALKTEKCNFSLYIMSYFNEEVNCKEPFPKVSVPWILL
jgi:hypothetical protein